MPEQLAIEQPDVAVLERKPARSEALVPNPTTPADLLRIAVSNGAALEQIEKLMDLQERARKHEARMAFVQAMSEFKAHAIVVLKDKVNPQYNSKYVSLGNLVVTVTPFLSRHQLSVHWDVDQSQPAQVKVTAIITHALGHSESVSLVVPPDGSGSKNPIQQIKSAITYAKACTFESICGLASTDANMDDDGNGSANGGVAMNVEEHCEYLSNAKDLAELKRMFTAYYTEAQEKRDRNAQAALIAAKDRRKRELQ